ncbi:hypothetical protein ONZ78_04005 [Lactobacillus mulieris]|uniref:hypothetical protein n=1 Tax=Lactobacillus TaxID=1578 RepID=UPI001190BA6B|nr:MULTISPECIES: hypothetical protein [Lactobacillus]KAA9369487.1 hypothetical protein F6I25_02095 [Lactobacillus jensenii]MCW8105938.1 hypothetical protein [Lactobacillus mulieris]MCW8124769.1 hypothetical protein [Lactobacillus mulieris]MDK7295035.1 hypothetical protein [Lactobacillus jensenii]MDK7327902.1 hypothetical protein [Lactobacillus mulieris]
MDKKIYKKVADLLEEKFGHNKLEILSIEPCEYYPDGPYYQVITKSLEDGRQYVNIVVLGEKDHRRKDLKKESLKYLTCQIGRQLALNKIEKNYPNIVNAVEKEHKFNYFSPDKGYSHTFTFTVMSYNYLVDTLTITVVVTEDDLKNPPDYSRSLNYKATMQQLNLKEIGTVRKLYYEFMKNAISKLFYAQALMLIGVFAALIALSTQGSDRISLLGFATILLVISGSWALIEQISSFKKENEFISRLEELKWRVENDKVQM